MLTARLKWQAGIGRCFIRLRVSLRAPVERGSGTLLVAVVGRMSQTNSQERKVMRDRGGRNAELVSHPGLVAPAESLLEQHGCESRATLHSSKLSDSCVVSPAAGAPTDARPIGNWCKHIVQLELLEWHRRITTRSAYPPALPYPHTF